MHQLSFNIDCDHSHTDFVFLLVLSSMHDFEYVIFDEKRKDKFIEFTFVRDVNIAITFSSFEVVYNLLIPLLSLIDFDYVNVNGKRKVVCDVQIHGETKVNIGWKLEKNASQLKQCIKHLKGSVLIFYLVDYAYNFEFLDFLVITHKIHIDWFRFIFDLGALNWVYLQMDEIIRLTFDLGGHQI